MAIDKDININIKATEDVSKVAADISKNLNQKMVKALVKTESSFARVEAATKLYKEALLKQNQAHKITTRNLESFGDAFEAAEAKTLTFGEKITDVAKKGAALTAVTAGYVAISVGQRVAMDLTSKAIIGLGSKAIPIAKKGMDSLNEGFNDGLILANKISQNFSKLKGNAISLGKKGLQILREDFSRVKDQAVFFIKTFRDAGKIIDGSSRAFVAAAKHTELFEKGLTGAITRAGVGASAFGALGTSLLASDGIMNKMAGVTLIALAVALGGLVAIAHQLLNVVGDLAIAIGDNLTEASLKQIETFSEAEKTTFAFNQTIASYSKNTEEAAENTAHWTKFQEMLSAQTGTTAATMKSLIAETISATEAAGLNQKQMEDLIGASIDLSERAHKPAIDTLTALINAMNGSGQAVIALGLHINDSAIAHSKLTHEQKENFKSADDATKAQTRFAVIMEQAGKAAGFASNNADLYSKSLKLQKNAQETLNSELGKGAAIINGQVVLGLASATNAMTSFFKPILPGIGLLQALGGRLFQVTGFLVKNALTITLLTSSYKALNILLAKGFGGGAFGKELPFINKSLGRMAKELGATNIRFDSLKGVAKASLQILRQQSINTVKSLLGLEASAKITARAVGGNLVKAFKQATLAIRAANIAMLRFLANPVVATVVAIAAALFLLFKAAQKVNEETKIFNELWLDLKKTFEGVNPVVQMAKNLFLGLARIISKIFTATVKLAAASLASFTKRIFQVVWAFQKMSQILPGSMKASQESILKTEERIKKLDEAASKLAKGGLNDLTGIFMSNAAAADRAYRFIDKIKNNIASLGVKVEKFKEKAKKAFEFASEFTPNINLAKFTKESQKFEGDLNAFKSALTKQKKEIQKAIIIQPSEGLRKQLAHVEAEIAGANEAIKAVSIKNQREISQARLKVVEIESIQKKQLAISSEDEVKMARIDAAYSLRDQLIDIEAQRLLAQRGLAIADLQEGITVQQAAAMEANTVQLEAFRARLNAEKELALSFEKQKQMEVLSLRASLLSGTSGEASVGQEQEVIAEQQKITQLEALRNQGLINEQQYQADLTAIKISSAQKRAQLEVQKEQERIAMLGLSPEAMTAKIDLQLQQDAMELEALRTKLTNKQITEQEFRTAEQELTRANEVEMLNIRKDFLTKQIAQDKSRGDKFSATLKEIELSQQTHGKVMGTLKALQASSEMSAISNMFGNLSSLRNSESRKEFEIGKKAAIAQAGVSMLLGATQAFSALSSIPIVGPALGTAAAAAAIAAGMMNIRQIKAQKFQGGGGVGNAGAPAAPTATQTLGGQFDQGTDAVPRSLNGKSFILSAGERVVQPEANKDLTGFLREQRGGGSPNVNITINGNVNNREDAEMIADKVIEELRSRSERGETVISSKGVA